MKNILIFCLAFLLLFHPLTATAALKKPVKKNTRDLFIQLGNGPVISIWDLAHISVKEVQVVTGKKMKLFDRLGFRAAQYQLRKSINPDGTLSGKRLERKLKKIQGRRHFNLGGFALGFFGGILGVLVAYMITGEDKPSRTLWAWIGLATIATLIGVALALK